MIQPWRWGLRWLLFLLAPHHLYLFYLCWFLSWCWRRFRRWCRWRFKLWYHLLLPNLLLFWIWFHIDRFILFNVFFLLVLFDLFDFLDLFILLRLILLFALCRTRSSIGMILFNLLVSLITTENIFYLPSWKLEMNLSQSHINDSICSVEKRSSKDERNFFIGSLV